MPECPSPARTPTSSAHKHGKTSATSDLRQNLYGKNHKGWVRGKKRGLISQAGWCWSATWQQNSTLVLLPSTCRIGPAEADAAGARWTRVHRWCQKFNTGVLGSVLLRSVNPAPTNTLYILGHFGVWGCNLLLLFPSKNVEADPLTPELHQKPGSRSERGRAKNAAL